MTETDPDPEAGRHACPGCERTFESAQALYGHWSTHPDHRRLNRDRATGRIQAYLNSVGPSKRRDAVGVAVSVFAGSLLIHVPGLYFELLRALTGVGIHPAPATAIPAAAAVRLLQKVGRQSGLAVPITEQQVDEIVFGAAVTWLAIETGHQLAALG